MKKILFLVLIIIVAASFVVTSFAHSGRTDSAGGHYDHKNGGYHYHHGSSAHDHYDIDGDGDIDCPQEFFGKIITRIVITLLITAIVSFGVMIWLLFEFSVKNTLIVSIPTFAIISAFEYMIENVDMGGYFGLLLFCALLSPMPMGIIAYFVSTTYQKRRETLKDEHQDNESRVLIVLWVSTIIVMSIVGNILSS